MILPQDCLKTSHPHLQSSLQSTVQGQILALNSRETVECLLSWAPLMMMTKIRQCLASQMPSNMLFDLIVLLFRNIGMGTKS